jgi:hypothetical protein
VLPLVAVIASFFVTISFGWPTLNEKIGNVVSLHIENADTGQTIPSTMHGVILETNINSDDDGGIYAELVYNRAFQGRYFS